MPISSWCHQHLSIPHHSCNCVTLKQRKAIYNSHCYQQNEQANYSQKLYRVAGTLACNHTGVLMLAVDDVNRTCATWWAKFNLTSQKVKSSDKT